MPLHRTIINLFLFLIIFTKTHSQGFIYKHYGVQDGLPNPTIYCFFQDRDGFLWFGTESGLTRYDGSHFKTFTVKDGLPGNDVFEIVQDRKGRMWLEMYKNAIAYIYKGKIYDQGNDSLLKQLHFLSRVCGIAEDRQGNLAICDNDGLYIISPEGKILTLIRKIDGAPFKSIHVYTDSTDRFMLCTSHSLYRIENLQPKLYKVLSPDNDNLAQNSILLNANYIVLGNENHPEIHLKDTMLRYALPQLIIKFSSVSDSVLSINTVDGAYLFNIHDHTFTRLLPGSKISSVFVDREGNLWLGTLGNGLFKISSQAIVNKKISGAENSDISYIARRGDKIIVANNSMQGYEYDGKTFTSTIERISRDLYLQKIFYYENENAGRYIFAHGQGIVRKIRNGPVIGNLVTHSLKDLSLPDKDHFLAAVHYGIWLIRKTDLKADTLWNRKGISALATGDSILAGTLNGLYVLKKINDKYSPIDSMLTNDVIGAIKKTGDQHIWVGTYEDGLYCLKNGKIIRHFSDSSGLLSNNCRCLYIFNNDVWLGTDNGLVKITTVRNDFNIQRFSTSDGLPSNVINTVYTDNDTVYIGTPEGFCYFDQKKITTPSFCNLVLTGVRIGDSVVEFSDKYILRKQERFIVEFAGISFRSENDISYRYRIDGIDDNWHNTRLNSLEFASLPYGDYELEIIAINKSGKESPPLKVMLHIIRPFYKTVWFILLMVLLPLAAIFFVFNRRAQQARKKQMLKLQQEIKMMELEQMALRSQMNPHFIFNCINTIQQLVTEKDTANTHRFITSFSDLLRQALDNAPELFIPLDDEIKFLRNYFELERIRLEDLFSYRIDTSCISDAEQVLVPNMIIQPYVENAIKHGIRYKKDGKGLIEVLFERCSNGICCTVTDNGIGREKAEQLKKESGIKHKSHAMAITSRRIESLNALIGGKISIAVEDMKDEQGNVKGTKVIINFF